MFYEYFENLCEVSFGKLIEAYKQANLETIWLYERAILVLAWKWAIDPRLPSTTIFKFKVK